MKTAEAMRQALEALEALPGKIMNVSADGATLDWANTREAYMYGHRDARHAAAEIASSFIAALRTALDAPQAACAWRQEDEESGTWWTDCSHGFTFNDGGPKDNRFKHCCYCGKPLVEVEWTEPADEDDKED